MVYAQDVLTTRSVGLPASFFSLYQMAMEVGLQPNIDLPQYICRAKATAFKIT